MKTLLVPIDFSDVTEDVIRNVIKAASLVRGQVILLHVIQTAEQSHMSGGD